MTKRAMQPTLYDILKEVTGQYTTNELVELTGFSKAQISKTCKKFKVPFVLETYDSYIYKIYNLTAWNNDETTGDKLI